MSWSRNNCSRSRATIDFRDMMNYTGGLLLGRLRFCSLLSLGGTMRIGRIVMGVGYVAAGILHFVATRMYEGIMPDYLPAHHELVVISGAAEIAGGLGIM